MSQPQRKWLAAALLCALPGLAPALDFGGLVSSAQRLGEAATRPAEPSDPAAEERLIGEQAALEILAKAPLAPLPGVQRYVNMVGRAIAMKSERPGLDWRFAVIDDAAANAWAAPDGYIFITTGMMSDMQSEAELAGVLAHEITHVVQRHHLKAVQQAASRGKLGELVGLTRDTLGSQGVDTGSSAMTPQLQALRDSVGKLYDKGLSRADELEADRLGVALAGRVGYDPFGLPTVLQALGARGKDDPSIAVMARTHPSIDDRLNKLEAILDALDPALFPGRELRERFRNIVVF